jgi:hypothetical protein
MLSVLAGLLAATKYQRMFRPICHAVKPGQGGFRQSARSPLIGQNATSHLRELLIGAFTAPRPPGSGLTADDDVIASTPLDRVEPIRARDSNSPKYSRTTTAPRRFDS